MDCPTAETLFEDYIRATRNHIDAAVKLSNLVGSEAHFAEARRHSAETFAKCEATFAALTKHRSEHNCMAPSPAQPSPEQSSQDSG
jgi:hypothetical protein